MFLIQRFRYREFDFKLSTLGCQKSTLGMCIVSCLRLSTQRSYLIGRNFVGRNFRREKLFVGRNFRHFQKNSSLSPDKVSPDKVCGYNDDISALLYYNKDPSFFDAHNICKCHYTTFVKFRFNQISKYSETSL